MCTYINVFNCVVVEARKVVHARMPCLRVICCTHTVNSKIGRQLRCLLYCSAYALLDIHVYVPTHKLPVVAGLSCPKMGIELLVATGWQILWLRSCGYTFVVSCHDKLTKTRRRRPGREKEGGRGGWLRMDDVVLYNEWRRRTLTK